MSWEVVYSKKAEKQQKKLSIKLQAILDALVADIKMNGPVRGTWPNYSKLRADRHHCHLKKGNPTYVAVWQIIDKQIKIVEIVYAGTHEKAPY